MTVKKKLAVITGINGQDGFYLSRFLLRRGYVVVGIQRRTSSSTSWRLNDIPNELRERLHLVSGDVTDFASISSVVSKYQPDEFYNLAAQSHVWHSFKSPLSTLQITGMGAAHCLEAIRQFAPSCRFYQAGSSEQFGNSACEEAELVILNEHSTMHPRSPYGVAKQMAYDFTRNYREAYGLFAVAGLLFNHESPYRGEEFVTRKITKGIASIIAGHQDILELGNLESCRDWGHAEDYMKAAWMMLQQDTPYDYVIATGETYSVRTFLEKVCDIVDIDIDRFVTIDENLYRPSEIHLLVGDSSKAKEKMGWVAEYTFDDLVYQMIREDLGRLGVLSRLDVNKD